MSNISVIQAGSAVRAVIPTDFEQVTRFAKTAVMAGMFAERTGSKSNEDDNDLAAQNKALAQATMAILQGMECGIPPMQAVQQIAVIKGRCTIWGDLVPALIWRAGHKIKEWSEGKGDDRVAHCEITRSDSPEPIKRSFSISDAKQAGLWSPEAKIKGYNKKESKSYDKDNDSPWHRYPDRMLQMRARGFCARDAVPDVLRGLYVREELEDEQRRFEQARDVTPQTAKLADLITDLMPPPAPEEEAEIKNSLPQVEVDQNPIYALESQLEAAQTEEAIDEIWGENLEQICLLGMHERERVNDLYEFHVHRVQSEEAA